MLSEVVLNPKYLKAIYGDHEPDLSDILVNSIQILPNTDSHISLNLILKDFPVNPPKKWDGMGYDTISLSLKLTCVFDLEINGLDFVNAHSIDIKKLSDSEISISLGTNFKVSCKWIHIDGIDGFKDEVKTYPYDK